MNERDVNIVLGRLIEFRASFTGKDVVLIDTLIQTINDLRDKVEELEGRLGE